MALFELGNGDDSFDSTTIPGFTDGSTVDGGNGQDDIFAIGFDLTLIGANGDDVITANGGSNNLNGGNGDDLLAANGRGNTLDGGRGEDVLNSNSFGGFFVVGVGNILEGGKGSDTFVSNNQSDLVVTNNNNLPTDIVDDGDIIVGVIDEITDYKGGETLDIPAITEIELVGLDVFFAGHQHLELADGEYSILTGDLIDDGEFLIGSEGSDALVVWDALGGGDDPFFHGAIALLDTNPDAVVIG